jgi:hypothetical protein
MRHPSVRFSLLSSLRPLEITTCAVLAFRLKPSGLIHLFSGKRYPIAQTSLASGSGTRSSL